MTDLVNHPPHYEEQAIKLEPIDFCERLPFCEGNALKYCFRAGHKNGASELQDLKKALWYLNRSEDVLNENLIFEGDQEERFEVMIPFLRKAPGLIGEAATTYCDPDFVDFMRRLTEKVKERITELKKNEQN